MSLDPVRLADTRAWLARVESDLRGAAIDLAAAPPLLDDLAFHCQQAVEKALKALLTWYDEPFRRTHDLRELGDQCVVIDPTLASLLSRAASLAEYAWRFRYPNVPPLPSADDATGMLALAQEVMDAVLVRLPVEARP